ncbi:MAG: hypothetical protein PSV18_02185 [Methylobacter sp.]|uniref:Uncharacterized protein n=1 Tax=Candidatus Methylobacter titanis TaxID=3053457 RepID=A0AA43TL21_9GAMM|nr:hypothetical protein [Candidatus Methylobacter titanis]MDI1291537.1 hypothetical protein [Candidatus Methylobacter titanis]
MLERGNEKNTNAIAAPVCLSAHYFQEIFAILLDNALRYRRTDRPLGLDIAAKVMDQRICFRCADNGAALRRRRCPYRKPLGWRRLFCS